MVAIQFRSLCRRRPARPDDSVLGGALLILLGEFLLAIGEGGTGVLDCHCWTAQGAWVYTDEPKPVLLGTCGKQLLAVSQGLQLRLQWKAET
ncbi:MAG: hypothetical protein CMJ85_05615 [Planctomycetes bacterium]|nr:hypothetical protein [Planctomycetota bacterium]